MTKDIRNSDRYKLFVVVLFSFFFFCFILFWVFTLARKICINTEATTMRRAKSRWIKGFFTLKHCNYYEHGRRPWKEDIFWRTVPLFPGRGDYPEWLLLSVQDKWLEFVHHFIISRSAEWLILILLQMLASIIKVCFVLE